MLILYTRVFLLFTVVVVCNVSLGQGALSPEILNSPNWAGDCSIIRDKLRSSAYSNLLAENTLHLDSIGQIPIEVFGLSVGWTGSNLTKTQVESYDAGASIMMLADNGAYLSISIERDQFLSNYWDDDALKEISVKAFGETFSMADQLNESLSFSPENIQCTLDTKFADIRKIVQLLYKSTFQLKSPAIKGAFLVSQGDSNGTATCFERDGMRIIDFTLKTNVDQVITGRLRTGGLCRSLNGETDIKNE